jgi:hypothetical protein
MPNDVTVLFLTDFPLLGSYRETFDSDSRNCASDGNDKHSDHHDGNAARGEDDLYK